MRSASLMQLGYAPSVRKQDGRFRMVSDMRDIYLAVRATRPSSVQLSHE